MSNAPSSAARAGNGAKTPSCTARPVPTTTGAAAAGSVCGRAATTQARARDISAVSLSVPVSAAVIGSRSSPGVLSDPDRSVGGEREPLAETVAVTVVIAAPASVANDRRRQVPPVVVHVPVTAGTVADAPVLGIATDRDLFDVEATAERAWNGESHVRMQPPPVLCLSATGGVTAPRRWARRRR